MSKSLNYDYLKLIHSKLVIKNQNVLDYKTEKKTKNDVN